VTNQVAANTKERIAIAPRGTGELSAGISEARIGGGARGINNRFNGSPITMCSAAQMTHAPRQPNCASRKADSGHPTVLDKTRDQSYAGDRSPRRAAVKPGQRGESRVIEAHGHADAKHSPGDSESNKSLCGTEQEEPRGENQIGKREHAATATIVDRAADGGTQHGRQQQRAREEAEYSGTR